MRRFPFVELKFPNADSVANKLNVAAGTKIAWPWTYVQFSHSNALWDSLLHEHGKWRHDPNNNNSARLPFLFRIWSSCASVTPDTDTRGIKERHLVSWAFVFDLPPAGAPPDTAVHFIVSAVGNEVHWAVLPLWQLQQLGNIGMMPWHETPTSFSFSAVFFDS
jgi:hypothetical protein